MRRILFVALLALLPLAGCTTYSNIPAQAGDVARNDPNDEAVREVMVASLAAVAADSGLTQDFDVILPQGSTPETFQLVLPKVGPNALRADAATSQPSAARPSLEVKRLRIRGWIAQVDIIRPFSNSDPAGLKQLVTVDLKWSPIDDWMVQGLRVWRISVDQALREAPFEPTNEYAR